MDNQTPPQNPTPNPNPPSGDAPWMKPVQQPTTPPSQPNPPAPTPPPVPAQKPPAPTPPTPPPAPPKPPVTPSQPLTPKPIAPPPTVSSAAPPKPQSAQPQQEGGGLWWKILIALAILMALGVLGYSIWNGMTNKPTASVTPPIATPIPPLGNGDNGTTPTSTSPTGSATSSSPMANNYGFATEDIYPFGQPTSLFENDNDLFRDATRALGVKVIKFTDSRCPPGVQCVWAGELGVQLQVTDELTGQTQEVDLGMVRAKTASAFGSTFTLNEIDDGKGGTYASITVK